MSLLTNRLLCPALPCKLWPTLRVQITNHSVAHSYPTKHIFRYITVLPRNLQLSRWINRLNKVSKYSTNVSYFTLNILNLLMLYYTYTYKRSKKYRPFRLCTWLCRYLVHVVLYHPEFVEHGIYRREHLVWLVSQSRNPSLVFSRSECLGSHPYKTLMSKRLSVDLIKFQFASFISWRVLKWIMKWDMIIIFKKWSHCWMEWHNTATCSYRTTDLGYLHKVYCVYNRRDHNQIQQ